MTDWGEVTEKINDMVMKEINQTEEAIKDMIRHYGIKRTEIRNEIEVVKNGGRSNQEAFGGVSDERTDYYIAGEKAMTIRRVQKPMEEGYGFMVKQTVTKHWEE